MATTTNYGWTTPDDTALVKDGASAIRSLGSSIDTTTKNLNPQTTTGAIAYRSATANVNTSLPLGTAGQILRVNSGATAPEWATVSGTQLTETVFTSSNASWTIPSGVTGIWALVVGGGGGGGASSTATASNSAGGGGAGQVKEQFFAIAGGDTTLNITVGGGGAGATTQGAKGSNGSASTIVGNTSATTYVTSAGGGGGGGGAAANVAGNSGASGGGNGSSSLATQAGGGGGMFNAAMTRAVLWDTTFPTFGGGGSATTLGVTGNDGGASSGTLSRYGGAGIIAWNRVFAGGGNSSVSGGNSTNLAMSFGAGAAPAVDVAGNNATANTGAGGSGASTATTTQRNGGNGGSGIVILRYIG